METVTSLGRNYSSESQIFFPYSLTCSLASFNLLLTDSSSKLLAHSHSQTHILVEAKVERGCNCHSLLLPLPLTRSELALLRAVREMMAGAVCSTLPCACPRYHGWHGLVPGRQGAARLPHEPQQEAGLPAEARGAGPAGRGAPGGEVHDEEWERRSAPRPGEQQLHHREGEIAAKARFGLVGLPRVPWSKSRFSIILSVSFMKY